MPATINRTMGSQCCIGCFAYEWLRQYVHDTSTEIGKCDYCGSKRVAVVDVGALYDPFKNLLELYVPSDDSHGEWLVDLIQWDYEVFDDDLHGSDGAARLLEDILGSGWDDDDGEPPAHAHDLYRHDSWYHTTMAEAWWEFCAGVIEDSTRKPDFPELLDEELARLEVDVPQGTVLYRARIGFVTDKDSSPKPFEGADIHAPPAKMAKAGRANTKGQVVLYVADQETTAVAEVRPWRGLLVSVAELQTAKDLSIVDLSKAPPPPNPFIDDAPRYERELEELLIAFGKELGKPLRRADNASDYLPSQNLVRRIRQSGFYDGIRYPSAMAPDGTNIVLFEPRTAWVGPSRLVEVTCVGVTYGPPEDDWGWV